MLKMILDNILVEPDVIDTTPQMTAGGIYVAVAQEDNMARPFIGTVLDVGPGAFYFGQWIAPTVKVGDKIQYKPNTGYPIMSGYDEYVCLKESDILALITE